MGCDIGFGELLAAGEISRRPRLFCAQPLACSPICTAFLEESGRSDGKPTPEEWNAPVATIAEGASIARPVKKRREEKRREVTRRGGKSRGGVHRSAGAR